MLATNLAASGAVVATRTSPTVGSARNSISLNSLPQLVQCHGPAPEQGAPVSRRLDPFWTAVKQRDANRVFELGDRLRDHRNRDGELARRLGHAAGLRDCMQYMQVPQLDAPADTVRPLHVFPLSQTGKGNEKIRDFMKHENPAPLQGSIGNSRTAARSSNDVKTPVLVRSGGCELRAGRSRVQQRRAIHRGRYA